MIRLQKNDPGIVKNGLLIQPEIEEGKTPVVIRHSEIRSDTDSLVVIIDSQRVSAKLIVYFLY